MSELIRLFNESQKPRVSDAREIPERQVNFIDIQDIYQKQFDNFMELRKTTFTTKALEFYTEEYANMVVPESWRPIEEGISLHRWQPGQGYYNPGSPQD